MQNITRTIYCDVAVIGGGVGGCAAAIEASRRGMRTVLFEKGVSLGGLATNGYVPSVAGNIEGICLEFVQRLDAMGQLSKRTQGTEFYHNPVFEPEYGKLALEDLMFEAGSRIIYDSTLIDTVVENDRISAAIFYTKGGYVEVKAKFYIDATGDGDVSALSGVPYEVGGQEFGGLNIASTLGTRWAGADLVKYRQAEEKWNADRKAMGLPPAHFIMELEKQAIEAGELSRTVGGPSGFFKLNLPNTPEECADFVTFAFHTYYCHNTDVTDISRQVLEQHQLIKQFHAFLRKYVPGYENVRLIGMGSIPGVRESRRVFGEYMLKAEDVAFGRKFEDGIARFPEMYDTHHPTSEHWFFQRHIHVKKVEGSAVAEDSEKGIHCDARMHPFGTPVGIPVRPDPRDYCDIPYRCLVPEKIDNLLCAGRCCSAEFHANGAMRIIGPAMGTGHAAGLAASVSVMKDIRPRDIDGRDIRKMLIDEGVRLDQKPGGHWEEIRNAEGELVIGASDAISFRRKH